ncbi:hypothetical protein [Halobaculum sp. MBLA0143]|uniref:hypothetical protein n=1 Tax=Halobaculum sp. MBLA0143 TaxID=3079933 RepID=UPI003524C119
MPDGDDALDDALSDGDDPTARVRRRVREQHPETLDRVWRAADAVADEWTAPPSDRTGVTEPFERRLTSDDRAGLLAVLETAAEALGASLPADPVPAPPYLVVTATGPILRATLPDCRLVVELRAFTVSRASDGPATYRRDDDRIRVRLR